MHELLDALKGTAFRSIVAGLPGYDASRAGEVLTVREAFPWYDRASAVERDDAGDNNPQTVAPSPRSPV